MADKIDERLNELVREVAGAPPPYSEAEIRTIVLEVNQAIYQDLEAMAEIYEIGTVWSEEKQRFSNGLVRAIPLEAIRKYFGKDV